MEGIIFLLIVLVIIIWIGITMLVKIFKGSSSNRKQFEELNYKIDNAFRTVWPDKRSSRTNQLVELWVFASKTIQDELDRYADENGVLSRCDTASNLGNCGISDTHFFMHLDETDSTEYDNMLAAGNLSECYKKILSLRAQSKGLNASVPINAEIERRISYIEQFLPAYVKLKKYGCNSYAKGIALDDIVCFKVEGSVHHLTNVHGGGVNMQGAAVGAILGGGTAAIIGSRIGTGISTEHIKQDDRKIVIFYKDNGEMTTIAVESSDVDETIRAFRQLIPQKEESIVQVEVHKQPNAVTETSAVEELKQFKELLDCGIISQEEFDAKKKQILGL